MKISVFWFRRDLRLDDNRGLNAALNSGHPVLPVFIFDKNIISELPSDDARVNFIHESLENINREIRKTGSSIYAVKDDPVKAWKKLIATFDIGAVYLNKDYEPYAVERDNEVEKILKARGIPLYRFKDQVIFEESEINKTDGRPYTVFTPYSKRWLLKFRETGAGDIPEKKPEQIFFKINPSFQKLEDIGFRKSSVRVSPYKLAAIQLYEKFRNLPAADRTSYLSPHLRFGTVSIREIAARAYRENILFLNELIWREFFMQILFHFPGVITGNFRNTYDNITWRNNEKEFERWCLGETGYPMVDAGMRQLNQTGYMHNRVRMITAGFLCKHLLIDWRWGEAYYAEKLLDYELSSNNGNWQWAAGTGCDAAPYFRVFNPETQQKKFDPENEYVKRWIPELGKKSYPAKIVDHNFARQRAIETYRTDIRKI